MIHVVGLAALAPRYDGYIVDLWGVIHDGVTPYPGALACLRAMRDRGSGVVLLSNAPRRAAIAAEGLRGLGVADDLYRAIITSGEATYQALAHRPDPWWQSLGRHVFHLGPPRDGSVFAGLDLVQTATPATASFVLNTGPDDERSPTDPEAFDDVLEACRAADLPMVCANPDLTVVRDGCQIICAGTLAERYQALGGSVRSVGKPDPAIYSQVLARLGMPRQRILAIGDSLRTDIAGATTAGIDGLWILGGIHGHQTNADAAAEAAALGLQPTATMRRLVW